MTLPTIPIVETNNASIPSLSVPIFQSDNVTSETSTSLPNLSGLSSVIERVPQPGPHSKSDESDTITQEIERPRRKERKLIDNVLIKLKELYPRELDNLIDPLDLLNDFANTSWNDSKYRDKTFKEYDWYLLPPYIQLLLHHKESIDLLSMPEPTPTVLDEVYSMMSTIHNEETFYSILMTHIEKHHLRNYTDVIWKDPTLQDQLDPDNLLPKIVEFPWHQRYLHSPAIVSEIFKWYMYPPFLHISIFYKDKINLTSLDEPTWSTIDNILSVAYDSIMRLNSTEMDRFYNKIIDGLITYYKSIKTRTVPQVPSILYVPNSMTIETQTDINELEIQSDNVTNIVMIDIQPSDDDLRSDDITSNKRTQQSPDETLLTPRDILTKSYKRKKISNQTSGESSHMVVVRGQQKLDVNPANNTQILLDSGCSFHLINTHTEVENFVQNDANDSSRLRICPLRYWNTSSNYRIW